jgi:hypothetical protein
MQHILKRGHMLSTPSVLNIILFGEFNLNSEDTYIYLRREVIVISTSCD